MGTKAGFWSTGVELQNSEALLNYDYKKLSRDVSRAVIECPAIISLFGQKDLSMLAMEDVSAPEIHMRACLRMTCAFIGLKDPCPRRKMPNNG